MNIGERCRTGVNETETETRARRPATGHHGRGATPGEGRGGLVGAEPGSGPARPSQPRRAGRHAPVLLRRWLAPVPVHPRHRRTAVTECNVTNHAGGHGSRLRFFALVGRPDCEVICAQILRLWAQPPGSRGSAPRPANSSLYPNDWRIVLRRWAAVSRSPLPCAIGSRRAEACGLLA